MDFRGIIPEDDLRIAEASGMGAPSGWGHKPALLIVDAQNAFVGLDTNIMESIRAYPRSIGERAWRAIANIEKILTKFREMKFPVFYSIQYNPPADSPEGKYHGFSRKHSTPDQFREGVPHPDEIVGRVAPRSDEAIVKKMFSSPFFGTPLASFLFSENIDTLVVCGFVTSGCVRAAIVDAHSYHLKVVVGHDACADRFVSSHYNTLFETQMKYGDVVPTKEIVFKLDSSQYSGMKS